MSRAVEEFKSPGIAAGKEKEDISSALMSKTARTLVGFVILALLPYVVPGLDRYRILPVATVVGMVSAQRAGESKQSDEKQRDGPPSREVRATPGEIEDTAGDSLNHFFKALQKTETADALTRICHYGDSPITNDGITSTVRRKLQLSFGDAGHGFILIAKPWAWYGHSGILHDAAGAWSCDPMSTPNGDRLFGLGGASFVAASADAAATFGTAAEGEVGKAVSSFDIYYLAQPGGGNFDVSVDGMHRARVSTESQRLESGFYQVRVPEGAHKMTIKPCGNAEIRLFGVALETGGHGVQYDSLGVNGAFISLLARNLDEQHWIEQLRHRRPDLVIIGYGANESQFERLPMDQYERDTREVIRRVRTALPEVSILFVGPMDRGERGAGGKIVTRPMIPKLIAYQRRIAAETGCAFFDTLTAMGGEGTVARWRESKPRLMGGDFTHPTAQGSEVVGGLIYDALMKAYEQHKKRRDP